MKQLIPLYLLVAGILTFIMFGIDKYKAKKAKWRIPESSLILSCMIGGAFGGFLGMHLFHHKTRHMKFRIMVPLSVLLWCTVLILIFADII
jgi:uncharacterized membrane protein YsdA (DUF1294 family)